MYCNWTVTCSDHPFFSSSSEVLNSNAETTIHEICNFYCCGGCCCLWFYQRSPFKHTALFILRGHNVVAWLNALKFQGSQMLLLFIFFYFFVLVVVPCEVKNNIKTYETCTKYCLFTGIANLYVLTLNAVIK